MRIGIDYTAARRQGAGIGRYARELVDALLQIETGNEYVLLSAEAGLRKSGGRARAGTVEPTPPGSVGVRRVGLPVSDRTLAIVWHRLRLPLWVELFCGPLDLFHSPDFTLPPVRRARTILTVHDLSFMRLPECSDPKLRAYLLRSVPRSVRRADAVLADSECTRRDLIELLETPPERVRVLYAGVQEPFQRVQEAALLDTVRAKYGLPARFVLGLGTLQPRKNFERLIEAYALLATQAAPGIELVIAGEAGWMYEGIFRRVDELGLQGVVHLIGHVADGDLAALYTLAELFVFPSLYEGFGLPPLEAMACGTPVVASNVSCMPEVLGDAALLVDPYDTKAIAEAMQSGLEDAALRGELIGRGLERARRFTWAAAAQKLLEVYREVGGDV